MSFGLTIELQIELLTSVADSTGEEVVALQAKKPLKDRPSLDTATYFLFRMFTQIHQRSQTTSLTAFFAMSASPESEDHEQEQERETLSALETLRLSATHAYYSVSRALFFDKVTSLLTRADLSVNLPVALLGRIYSPATTQNEAAAREVLSYLVHHFHSTPWMTYRSDFYPLPAGENKILRSDAGWGCSLRSIQMIAAQTMIRHVLGPDWRWPLEKDKDQHALHNVEMAPSSFSQAAVPEKEQPPSELVDILRLFWDVPDANSPFSIHNICYHGAECAGVFPGRWLGPSAGCRALEATASSTAPGLFQALKIAVLGGMGGGAPVLGIGRYISYFEETLEGNATPTATATEENQIDDNKNNNSSGLLLLIPLVLGIGKLNPLYFPQLQAVLAMKQSVGFIGGKPGSSVYVVGCQGESLLYLDPHTIQPAATSIADWVSYSCDVLKTMWLSALDPSLALGFYCGNKEEYLDLCEELKKLEEKNPGMPLVCVSEGMGEVEESGRDQPQAWEDDEEEGDDEEEEFNGNGDKGTIVEGNFAGLKEVERQDREFCELPVMVGGGGEVVDKGEENEEEQDMHRLISELRQQSSKSVWEFV